MDQAGNTVVALEPLPARLASTGYWRQLHPSRPQEQAYLGRLDIRLLLAAQICVLGPLRSAMPQLERSQRTGNNAGQRYRQAS